MDPKINFQVVRFNNVLGVAYQNVVSGKPDCWDILSQHVTLGAAETAAATAKKNPFERERVAIRLSDDINPRCMWSDFYRIDPTRFAEIESVEGRRYPGACEICSAPADWSMEANDYRCDLHPETKTPF